MMEDYKRILIVNPFAIGDILSSTPIIEALANKFPNSFVGYMCNSRVQSILANDPRINEIFVLFNSSDVFDDCIQNFQSIKKDEFYSCLFLYQRCFG